MVSVAKEGPSALGAIDRVEIVDLRAAEWHAKGYMAGAVSAPFWSVEGDEAQHVASLWRELPPGEQARCHLPPFGFRFFHGDTILCEASVCWACNNISGNIGGRAFWFEFDAKKGTSLRLLGEAQRISGIQVAQD